MHWDMQFREKRPRLPGWNFRGVSLSCPVAQLPSRQASHALVLVSISVCELPCAAPPPPTQAVASVSPL